jgi:uncharacterized protein with von Willebrand factor type A (vWA) domain
MKKKYDVKAFLKEAKEQSKTSRASSRKVENELAHEELNDTDYEFVEFKTKNNELVEQKTKPIEELRRGIANSLKAAGVIDSADIEKVVDTEFNKATAEAFNNATRMHVRNALATGRFYTIEPGDKKSARAVLGTKEIDEKIIDTTKPTQKPDGTWVSELTGDRVKTEKHTEIGVRNKTGAHLKYKLGNK